MIVKSQTPQAQYAELLLCEALMGAVAVEGIKVYQPFEVAHPYLRANAYGYGVASYVLRPRDKIGFTIDHFTSPDLWLCGRRDTIPSVKECIKHSRNFIFSFMGLDCESRMQVRHLVTTRPSQITAVGIEGVTSNFLIEEFLPGVTIVDLGGSDEEARM